MTNDAITTVESELRRAEEDLSQALKELNHKVQDQLDLKSWIHRRPLIAAASASGLGFFLGMSGKSILLCLMLGVMVGFSVRGSNSET